jgi:hypothetical protein
VISGDRSLSGASSSVQRALVRSTADSKDGHGSEATPRRRRGHDHQKADQNRQDSQPGRAHRPGGAGRARPGRRTGSATSRPSPAIKGATADLTKLTGSGPRSRMMRHNRGRGDGLKGRSGPEVAPGSMRICLDVKNPAGERGTPSGGCPGGSVWEKHLWVLRGV